MVCPDQLLWSKVSATDLAAASFTGYTSSQREKRLIMVKIKQNLLIKGRGPLGRVFECS